jgi:hypothetical protein
MKTKIITLAIALIALFSFGTAQAQNPHFTDVVTSSDGLTITGKLAGLGNSYVGQTITITYGAQVTVVKVCVTPGPVENVVPGQSGTEYLTATKETTVQGREGRVEFTLVLDPNQVPVVDCTGQGLILDEEASSIEVTGSSLTASVGGTTIATY